MLDKHQLLTFFNGEIVWVVAPIVSLIKLWWQLYDCAQVHWQQSASIKIPCSSTDERTLASGLHATSGRKSLALDEDTMYTQTNLEEAVIYIYIYMYVYTYLYTLPFVICKPCWFFLISYSCMLASAKKNQTASAATEIRHKKKLQVGKPNDRMLMEFFPQILHSSGRWKLLEDQSILSSTPPRQSISKHPSCFQRWAWGTFDNVWWADGSQA